MPQSDRSGDTGNAAVLEGLERIAKLLGILVAEGKTQREAVLRLADVGFEPREIADLLGTTANTVRVTIHQARKSATVRRRRTS